MNLLFKLLSVLTLLYVFPNNLKAQEDGVEVVIATGLEISQASAFSPNSRFVAMALYNAVSIWDVNTGRMIRNTTFSDNITQVTDSIWFSVDSKKVICGIASSNDTYEVSVENGAHTYIEGPPMDWSTYKYTMSTRASSSMYLWQGGKKDLVYKSPDGQSELVYKKIPNPFGNTKVMPWMYTSHVKIKGEKLSAALDTVTQANFSWSPDNKFVFCESRIIDLSNGRIVSSLKMVPFSPNSVTFMPGTRMPVTAGVQSMRIWDFPDVEEIPIKDLSVFKPALDSRYVICERFNFSTGQKAFVKFDLLKKKRVGKILKSKETGYLLDVSDDATYFTFLEMLKPDPSTYDIVYKVKLCNSETGEVKELHNTTKAYFTPDPDFMLVDSFGMQNMKLNLKTGEMKRFPSEEPVAGQTAYYISRNHKYIMGSATISSEGKQISSHVYLWNVEDGSVAFKTEVIGLMFTGFEMSKDEKYIAFASDHKHTIHIYNFESGAELHKLRAHNLPIDKLAFSDDNARLLSSSYDGSRRLWNLETGEEMASLVNAGKKDFAIITPEQYYYATKGAKKLIHFVKGSKVFPFSQFDLKYNRPDIIIQSLEASNQGLVQPFYYAYQKRLKRLGFTEEMLDGTFHLPTASISNASELPVSTAEDKIRLRIKGNDEKFKLNRVLVRVNEVPISGKNGISVKDKSLNSVEEDVEIELSTGNNLIEVSVMNEKGVESIASNINITHEPSVITKPNLYLYTIGVSEYEQSDFNLTYAAKDATDILKLYGARPAPFNKIISKEYTNEQVTLETIKSIKEELMSTSVDDAVCVFFAGHGILDVELNYFLASHDIDFKDPGEKGIPYEVFEDILDDIPARKKLIMIDACHSGEIDKEEVALVEAENTTENEEDISFRAVSSTSLKRVGLNNSFELMRELFNDVKKSSGTVIISSAGGMEYAMEGGEWNNGVFTYCFLNGIKNKEADLNGDGKIFLSEMNRYVMDKVYLLTNGKQQPTNRAEVFDQDWRLW